MPSDSSLPTQIVSSRVPSSSSLSASPSSAARTSAPIVREVVAALLHDDGRQPERAERAAGGAEAVLR